MIMGHRLHITPRKDTVTAIHPKGLAQIFAEMGEDISELECREMISAATGGKEPQPQVFVCVCGVALAFFLHIYIYMNPQKHVADCPSSLMSWNYTETGLACVQHR